MNKFIKTISKASLLKYTKKIQDHFYSTLNNNSNSIIKAYNALCTEYYELDKPFAPQEALACYENYATEAKGPILEPMCGTGRFLIPLLKKGYDITGFDSSVYMLDVCRKKCQKADLSTKLLCSTFENFYSDILYQLIFIPSGSFCLLTEKQEIDKALNTVLRCLGNGGKFVFEIDTLRSLDKKSQGIWTKNFIDKLDGTKIVMNTLSHFDPNSQIQNILSRYELWDKNVIRKTEIEHLKLKLYEMPEIEKLLAQYNIQVINKWLPYTKKKPSDSAVSVLYECITSEQTGLIGEFSESLHKLLEQ